jgi:hypothetical protein
MVKLKAHITDNIVDLSSITGEVGVLIDDEPVNVLKRFRVPESCTVKIEHEDGTPRVAQVTRETTKFVDEFVVHSTIVEELDETAHRIRFYPPNGLDLSAYVLDETILDYYENGVQVSTQRNDPSYDYETGWKMISKSDLTPGTMYQWKPSRFTLHMTDGLRTDYIHFAGPLSTPFSYT